jgi:hypothetical protein
LIFFLSKGNPLDLEGILVKGPGETKKIVKESKEQFSQKASMIIV